jgi:hypothetical protein
MSSPAPAARTPGATRAGDGQYLFDLAKVNKIKGGPDYSSVEGGCVEGERMIVALMRMPERDVVFFTCKDSSHSLHGVKAA